MHKELTWIKPSSSEENEGKCYLFIDFVTEFAGYVSLNITFQERIGQAVRDNSLISTFWLKIKVILTLLGLNEKSKTKKDLSFCWFYLNSRCRNSWKLSFASAYTQKRCRNCFPVSTLTLNTWFYFYIVFFMFKSMFIHIFPGLI